MNGILGKIVDVSPAPGSAARAGEHALVVKLKAACLLPERCAVPEWLTDQEISARRTVQDMREIGGIGDSIVLTAAESERYLKPLVVEPPICYVLPETIELTLRWASGDKDPEYEAFTGGNVVKGTFTKEGEIWRASVATSSLFPYKPSAPATLTIKVGKLEATCTLMQTDSPAHAAMRLSHRPVYRMENGWYSIDISLSAGAGALERFMEKGREIDHFAQPEDFIHLNHEAAGHLDRLRIGSGWGWFDKLRDTPVASTGIRAEGDTIRLHLESLLDDGQNIRTSVVYTLFDQYPLLTLQRDYQKSKQTASDKKEDQPKEPIDEVTTVGLGFRTSWIIERGKRSGSRILCADKDRLAIVRSGKANDFFFFPDWKISGGWCLVEHPGRREQMLYLFDTKEAPNLASWAGPRTVTLEPSWSFLPLTPGHSVGVSLGLAAGELCGASADGAWIACRSADGGAAHLGIVARLGKALAGNNPSANVTIDSERIESPLSPLVVAGIGTLHVAVIELPSRVARRPLTAEVAGIASRTKIGENL